MVEAFKSCDVVRRRKNADATYRSWDGYGNLLINEFGGTTEMRQLTREQVETYMRKYETKVSPAKFNAALQFYKRVWNTLKKYDSPIHEKARLHEQSPWDYILPMKTNEVVGKKPFTKEQMVKIWRVLEEMGNQELTLLFDLAKNTGARLHDLVSWKWDEHLKFNTRLENGRTINEAVLEWKPLKTKNSSGKLMIIPILDERVVNVLHQMFLHREVGQEYILPRMLEMYNRNKACPLTHLCQSVFKKAGIQTKVKVEGNARANCVYGIHSFRHTLVSELFEKGVDLGTIQHLYTGHGSSYITELYAHAKIDQKRIDLSKLSRIETTLEPPRKPMANEDIKTLEDIKLMDDTSREVKDVLVSMIMMKSVKELTQVKDWIEKRISSIQ